MENEVKDGKVIMSLNKFIEEHERLLKVLKKGPEYENQKKELDEVNAEIARQEEAKKAKNAATLDLDVLRSKLPLASKPSFKGNLNAY